MSNKRITKVKFLEVKGKNKFLIEYKFFDLLKTTKNHGWDEYSFTTCEEPHDDLIKATRELIPHALNEMELPTEYSKECSFIGMTLSYAGEDDTMGVTATLSRNLKKANCPLILNTPHKTEKPYNEGGSGKNVLFSATVAAVNAVIDEVRLFLNGKRAQGELFNKEASV